jgi:hypothetical protein
MIDRPPSDAQTLAIVERQLTDVLPRGWSLHARRGSGVWSLRAPSGEAATYAVRVERGAIGRQLDAVLARLQGADGLPLIAAPFLSPTVRDALAERGISYADATGNHRIVADRPGLFVERQGASKEPWPTDDTLRSLRGRAAGRAVRALVDLRPPYGVRDVATRATVPLGSLSRTLDLLDREGLVTRGPRGDVVDLDWEGAVRRWAQDYEFARSNRTGSYLHPKGPNAITRFLTRPKRPYAVSGPRAARHLLTGSPAGPMALYVEDMDLAVERLGLEPATANADIVLVEGYDAVVFERTIVRDRIHLASPVQLAADLLTAPNGDTDLAAELLAWMRSHETAWRT